MNWMQPASLWTAPGPDTRPRRGPDLLDPVEDRNTNQTKTKGPKDQTRGQSIRKAQEAPGQDLAAQNKLFPMLSEVTFNSQPTGAQLPESCSREVWAHGFRYAARSAPRALLAACRPQRPTSNSLAFVLHGLDWNQSSKQWRGKEVRNRTHRRVPP